MHVRDAIVRNDVGLQGNLAKRFVRKATEFDADIWIEKANDKDGRRINAKSLMGIWALDVSQRDTVRIIAEGNDEQEAVKELVEMIETTFFD